MKVIIIEDEKLTADHVERLLLKIDPSIQVTHRFETVKESVEAFQNGVSADVLIVDIHLADGNSFEIFSQSSIDIPVIFTTAFDQYAIKAFQINSIDYLLKPINKEELQKALQKFHKLTLHQHGILLQNLQELTKNTQFKNRFLVKLGDNISSIKTEEIDHFCFEDGVVLLVTKVGKRFPVDYTLDQLEQNVDPHLFFRINRRIIIQIDTVQKVASFFNSRLKITTTYVQDENSIVSRERVTNFKEWLNG